MTTWPASHRGLRGTAPPRHVVRCLRASLGLLEKDYEVEATASPSGVTHVTFTRAGA